MTRSLYPLWYRFIPSRISSWHQLPIFEMYGREAGGLRGETAMPSQDPTNADHLKENSNVPVTASTRFHKEVTLGEFARLFSLTVPINGFPVSTSFLCNYAHWRWLCSTMSSHWPVKFIRSDAAQFHAQAVGASVYLLLEPCLWHENMLFPWEATRKRTRVPKPTPIHFWSQSWLAEQKTNTES